MAAGRGSGTPVELGVHQVIGGGPMPAYIRRPHDELLRAVLDPAVPASRLVVVRGGSSTGKTRAAYEAVAGRAVGLAAGLPAGRGCARRRGWRPGSRPGRCCGWVSCASTPTPTAARRCWAAWPTCSKVTATWSSRPCGAEQWNAYVAAARPGLKTGPADPAGTAGRLLERLPELTGSDPAGIDPARGGVIDVPPRFTAAEMATAARTGDPVLAVAAAAAASAGQDGQVTQYLAGVPDLLHRYAGPGGDPYGQAIITAAMDATRLGHADPLPAALLQDAAVGYLTGPQRTKDIESWRDAAAGLGHRRAQRRRPGPAARPARGRHRRGRLPGRRLPRPVWPPHPPGPAGTALTVGRPHRPHRRCQRPDPPRAGRPRPRPVPPRRRPMDNSSNPGQHRRRRPARQAPAPGQPRRHYPRRPMGRRPRQPRQPVGRRPAAAGAARGRGRRRGAVPWPPGPPATPASTTRGPSPCC